MPHFTPSRHDGKAKNCWCNPILYIKLEHNGATVWSHRYDDGQSEPSAAAIAHKIAEAWVKRPREEQA